MNQNSKQQPQRQTLADLIKNDKEHLQATQSNKIAITNKAIDSIGKGIPSKFTGITHLMLSNNHLTSLSGIESFQNLTHLSIASNEIESIEEMTKIFNKSLLVSLSVKKNFFLKNPQANIDLINLFPNIKYLDGFKISEATHKFEIESHSVSYQIMSFVMMVQHKISELNKLYSVMKLNDEFTRKKVNGMNSIDDIDKMMDHIKTLMRLNKVAFLNEDYIKKYLNKNINPSVHVLKKIMHNSRLSNDETDGEATFRKAFSNNEEYAHCYEALFSDILFMYESKKNYTELPFYLNYLIMKDNPILTKFFIQKIRQQQSFDEQSTLEKTYIETISSICKEFNSLFTCYTNYSINILTQYQMMYFYQIDKQSDVLSGFHPKAEDMMIYFDQGHEKISLDEFNRKVCLCLSNIECDSFPVFALNFDYMRNLTSVIQNRIKEYQNKTDKIAYFLQLLQERKKMFLPKAQNENELFKYHFAVNNMKTVKKEDHSQMLRGNKFNHTNKSKDYISSKSNSRSRSRSRSRSNSKSKSKNHQHNSHSSGHITDKYNPNARMVNKERSRSNETELKKISNNIQVHSTYTNENSIPLIVKPNEQFTLANNDENTSIDKRTNPITKSTNQPKALECSSKQNAPNSYFPSTKTSSDIIKQIKQDARANNLIKRYMKYHNGFGALDIITRLSPMKTFITRLSLKVIKLKLPYLISAIESHQLNQMKKRFLYDLWSNNQKYFLIKHQLSLALKKRILKVLKQHKTISIHLKRGYYGSLLSKSIFALKQHKAKVSNKKQRYNRVAYYYYSKLMKKVWLTIKFYHHIEKNKEKKTNNNNEDDDYPEGKYSNQCDEQSEKEYEKVFNFFHKEDDKANEEPVTIIEKGLSSDKGLSKGSYTTFNKKNQIVEEEEDGTDELDGNSNSLNQVNSLIDHLEKRLQSMNKTKKSKSKIQKEKEKCLYDSTSRKAINNSKGRNKARKNKNVKESNDMCPYCVSGLEHDKCVVSQSSSSNNNRSECNSNSLNPSNAKTLLLGAPNFIRNTSAFIHKNLNR